MKFFHIYVKWAFFFSNSTIYFYKKKLVTFLLILKVSILLVFLWILLLEQTILLYHIKLTSVYASEVTIFQIYIPRHHRLAFNPCLLFFFHWELTFRLVCLSCLQVREG